MTNKDPYAILGVSRSAAQDEIKQAYRRLAQRALKDRRRQRLHSLVTDR